MVQDITLIQQSFSGWSCLRENMPDGGNGLVSPENSDNGAFERQFGWVVFEGIRSTG